jgi:hypothetical protein
MSNQKIFTTVLLDTPRRIRFSNRAVQRVGELEKSLPLTDLRSSKRAQAAMVQWLWGCLIDDDAKAFATPEDLADVLPFPIPPARRDELMQGLLDAWNIAQPKTEKNADSSTPPPSPASS